jgi:flavin-dependent dehydrogenase
MSSSRAQPYDVVIAGGSFAGLTVATHVTGRVALIERGEIGAGQTSACATTLDVIQKLGLEDCIEEVHDEAVVHTRRHTVRFPLPYRFCTFSYPRFCRELMDRFGGDLIHASALRAREGAIETDSGLVRGHALVDATGWRAVLARSVDPAFPVNAQLTYGLEQPSDGFSDTGLHFYFGGRVRGDGYGWAFPAGGPARAGVLSYATADGVRDSTADFLAMEGLSGGRYHGGYLSAGLRPSIAGDVFVVGDAAGHCLPLTGEGIRQAVFFGQRLGALLNGERAGLRSRSEILRTYSEMQGAYQRRYRWLRRMQRVLRGWPDPPVGWFFRAFARGFLYEWICGNYWEVAAPIEPAPYLARAGRVAAEASA